MVRRSEAGRVGLLALLLLAAFLALLASDSVRYSFEVVQGRLVITTLGKRIVGPVVANQPPLHVTLAPQERYSTGQVLTTDVGLLGNGLRFAWFLLRGVHDGGNVCVLPVQAGGSVIHFNPFRAALLVRQGGRELCRLDVNIPDASIDVWQGDTKAEDVSIAPSWLRLIVAPLGAAVVLAALVTVLVGLGRAGRPATGPERGAHPWLKGRAKVRVGLTTAGVFAVGTVVVGFIFFRVFHAMPGFGDEINYLMQGRIFAAGKLAIPEPAMSDFFKVGWTDLWWTDGKVWGFHPPGNSLLLALGWLVGAPWLTVPLVAGAIFAVQHRMALELFGSELFALLHVAILGTSHYVLSLASSYMAHAPSLLVISLFFLCLVRFWRYASRRSLVLAALWIGVAFVIRPASAVLAAAVPLLVLALSMRRKFLGTYAIALVVGLIVSSTVFLYTYGITGRLTLPYLVKGPEVGQTVLTRLEKPIEYHLANLYRNLNEFQHRVHSFGILGNLFFFFVPLVTWTRQRDRHWLALAYGSFGFYVVGHSFLHWYGWKWEPRMLYDVSFLFFLVTTAGVQTLAGDKSLPRWARGVIGGVVVLSLGYVAAVNLPYRFANEYRNYNSAPAGVMEEIHKQGIHNAVVFFDSEMAYASYLPFNNVGFDGDIVFAKSIEENYDYRLLTKFPSKRAYVSTDGMTMRPRSNFYRRDAATLARQLGTSRHSNLEIVMPWLAMAPTPLNEQLPGKLVDPGQFLESLAEPGRAGSGAVEAVFLGTSTDLAPLVDLFNVTSTTSPHGFDGPISFRTIGAPRASWAGRLPGLWMTCYSGTTWSGEPISRQLVSSFDLGPCVGESRSITWDTRFELRESRKLRFALGSDDGSALSVDGRVLIDNGLDSTHGPESKSASVTLLPGVHSLEVRYFNGPDGEFLRVTLADREGRPRPLTAAAFIDDFYLFVDAAGARPKEVPR